MRRLQRDRSRLQPRPNRRRMQQLQKHSQQTHRRQVQIDRGQRLQGQGLMLFIPYLIAFERSPLLIIRA